MRRRIRNHAMQLAGKSFDCVFCIGILEHVANPWRAIEEIYRVTRLGGNAYIDVLFIQGYHTNSTDYRRLTVEGLLHLCGLIWIAREWANSVRDDRVVSNLCLITMALIMTPLKYLDYLLVRTPRSHRVASAVYFRGRKPLDTDETT